MICRKPSMSLFFVIMILSFSGNVIGDSRLEKSEDRVISATGISQIRFRDISRSDFIYKGVDGAESFEIFFKKTAKARNMETCKELLSELDLDVISSENVTTVRLIHGQSRSGGVFNRMFKQEEWRTVIEMTGPQEINMEAEAEFSKIRIDSIDGDLAIDTGFSDTDIRNQRGHLQAKNGFGDFTVKGLDGSFDLDTEFGHMDIRMINLDQNSKANTNFGNIEMYLPRNTGAEFYLNKSFGDIKFKTQGDLVYRDEKGNHRILNNGGPTVNLNTEFGSITIRDDQEAYQGSPARSYVEDAVMPLTENAWWQYSFGENSFILRVGNIRFENSCIIATLTFDGPEGRPFDAIDVCETEEGLYITGIDGYFLGRDLSGIRFDPPKLWLPYDGDNGAVQGDEILGAAKRVPCKEDDTDVYPDTDCLCYAIHTRGYLLYDLKLVPGVGITAFGNDMKLMEYNLAEKRKAEIKRIPEKEEPPPPPEFEQGVVKSISYRGLKYIPKKDVEKLLDIKEGNSYSRDEIGDAVNKLPDKSKFITSASYSINYEGDLRIHVYETDLYSWDWDGEASFSRVAGVGFGPRLTLNSLVGPLSKISGSTQYHWGNKEWTYRANAEKKISWRYYDLTLGGTYRLDYESGMDWAIPKYDSYLNAFLLGLETKNYYEVEGATGYITQSFGNMFDITAEYFEEDYSSVKKHTNWSVGNNRHKKEDNPPLSPAAVGNITGMHYSAEFRIGNSFANSVLSFSAERTYDRKLDSLPEYTRYMGSAVYTSRFPYRNLIKIRVVGGYSEDVLPEQKAFRLGGLNTLRGFDFGSIPEPPQGMNGFDYHGGGNRMFLTNIDYFLSGDDEFGMVLFGDVGNVWIKGEDTDVEDLRRDLGVGLVFEGDFFPIEDRSSNEIVDALRINWAVPVGPEPHVSHWTVSFVRSY
ncbi:MAG: BamA/TamA family outer membrane protein [Candidatus Latescibacteria bacterium]|nr:BamA/TamA family outer membrane protein [Candidatus Latescibacterota bacterium]